MSSCSRRQFTVGAASVLIGIGCHKEGAAGDEPIGPLLPPSVLAGRIDEVRSGKIAVFYIGPDALFARGHVPGARRLAPLDSEAGQKQLAGALANVSAETEIVLYCGCCPVRNCPNVRPASAAVRSLRRTNAYVLDLPTRFATDWAEKGYPVETS